MAARKGLLPRVRPLSARAGFAAKVRLIGSHASARRGRCPSNSDSGCFRRHSRKIFIDGLRYIHFQDLVSWMAASQPDLQKIITQRFSPAVATRLKRDDFQRSSNKALAERA